MNNFTKQKSPEKQADYIGITGRFWRLNLQERNQRADWTATCEMLLLNCPGAHIAWNHWVISVIHLRDIPGVPPAHKKSPEFTHELGVYALDPAVPVPEPDLHDKELHFLTPIDHVIQFQVPSDAAAVAICDRMAEACCDGITSPDQDFRAAWRQYVAKLAEHWRGEHGGGGEAAQ